MNHIQSLRIKGLKKFYFLEVNFNEQMNILVGENEAGKSTILEALKIVLNQQYRTADKSVLQDLFNAQMVAEFRENPSIKTLPSILIEAVLELDPKTKNADYFFGEVYGKETKQAEKYGIRFKCKYDEELDDSMEQSVREGKIPYEYYTLTWKTFANLPYQTIKRPLKFLSIDTASGNTAASFNYFNRTLFISKYDEAVRMKAKNEFRENLEKAFESIELLPISETRKFGVDSKKVVLETVLSVYEDSVALENRGSGMESLIKTQIALDKASGLDVILVEEPENHLCFSNLKKMIQEISNKQSGSQIIIATHSNMIASKLNLNNVLWITENNVLSLSRVDKRVADFFVKAADNAFLQLLLSTKVFLVEGPTESLLLPYLYQQKMGHAIEKDGISVICCNGISYPKYLSIAKTTNKRVAVITDNDKNQKKINDAAIFNQTNDLQHIFMGETPDDWTWETCMYNANRELLNQLINVEKGAEYLYHGEAYGPVLGKMLNNKVDTAYLMITSDKTYQIPQYIEEAIAWINK